MTGAEHMAWAKERALEYAPADGPGDAGAAMSSRIQDLSAHPETAASAEVVTGLMMPLALIGDFRRPGALRKFIEGFHR